MSSSINVTIIHAGFEPGAFYVMSQHGQTPAEARVSGPWGTAEEAESDRRQLNIADECYIAQERPTGAYEAEPMEGIAGYTYRADTYCPLCTVEQTARGTGWYATPFMGNAEEALNRIADAAGIDRTDERSFDTDAFPKPLYFPGSATAPGTAAALDGAHPYGPDVCASCGRVLVAPQLDGGITKFGSGPERFLAEYLYSGELIPDADWSADGGPSLYVARFGQWILTEDNAGFVEVCSVEDVGAGWDAEILEALDLGVGA